MGSSTSFPLVVLFISWFDILFNKNKMNVKELVITINRIEEVNKHLNSINCSLNSPGNLEIKSELSKDLWSFYVEKLKLSEKLEWHIDDLKKYVEDIKYGQ